MACETQNWNILERLTNAINYRDSGEVARLRELIQEGGKTAQEFRRLLSQANPDVHDLIHNNLPELL